MKWAYVSMCVWEWAFVPPREAENTVYQAPFEPNRPPPTPTHLDHEHKPFSLWDNPERMLEIHSPKFGNG